jgi:hypothetical protein
MSSSPNIRTPGPSDPVVVSEHRFTVPVVRSLPRPLTAAVVDARVW